MATLDQRENRNVFNQHVLIFETQRSLDLNPIPMVTAYLGNRDQEKPLNPGMSLDTPNQAGSEVGGFLRNRYGADIQVHLTGRFPNTDGAGLSYEIYNGEATKGGKKIAELNLARQSILPPPSASEVAKKNSGNTMVTWMIGENDEARQRWSDQFKILDQADNTTRKSEGARLGDQSTWKEL